MTGISMKAIKGITSAMALATMVVLGAGSAQAADSNDRIVPPSPAEVAILRGLLALQHPSLRQGATVTTPAPVAATPTAAEPAQQAATTASNS